LTGTSGVGPSMLPKSRKYALRSIVPGTGSAVGGADATSGVGLGDAGKLAPALWLGRDVAADGLIALAPPHAAASEAMAVSSVARTCQAVGVEPFICCSP
jgi:hypothetical protein